MQKKEAIAALHEAAIAYHENLENKSLLFIGYKPSSKEIISVGVSFSKSNFLHLTGVEILSNHNYIAKDFYDRCLSQRLSPKDFEFASDGTTELKLSVLPQTLRNKSLNARMLGDFNETGIFLYTEKLVGNNIACVGFIWDGAFGSYIPNTFLKSDIRQKVQTPYQVLAVYKKDIADSCFSEAIYFAKNAKWDTIIYPKELSGLPIPNSDGGSL